MDFNFTDGINSIEGENGASKTSIFMTLMQGLYNRNAKGTKIDEVNNYITGLPYEIEVHFSKNSTAYSVINSRKSGTIEIYRNGKPIHVKRIPDNLKIIEDILGVDYSMFQDLVYQSPKSSINLLETGSDSSRKAFINKILKLDELDAKLEKAKQQLKEIDGKNGKLESLKKNLYILYQSTDEDYAEVQDELWCGATENNLEDSREKRDRLKSGLSRIEAQLKELYKESERHEKNKEATERIAQLESVLTSVECPTRSLEELTEAKHMLELQLKDLNQDIIYNQNNLKLVAEDNKKLQEIERIREELKVSCGDITLEESESNITNFKKDIAENAANILSYRKELQTLRVCAETGSCPTCNHTVDKKTFKYRDTKLCLDIAKGLEETKTLEAGLAFEGVVRNRIVHNKELQVRLDNLLNEKACPFTIEDIENTSSILNDRLDNLTKELQQHVGDIEKRKGYNRLFNEILELQRLVFNNININEVLADIVHYKAEKESYQNQLKEVEEYIFDNQQELKRIQEFNSIQRTLKAVNAQKRKQNELIEVKKVSCRKEIEDLEKTSDLLKIWVGILGSKGYRVHKIQSFLQQLNSVMTKYSGMLSEGKIKCSFYIDEGEIEFSVTDCNKTISWACWSEGEKARVKMACLFAVLELLEVMGSVSFNVLALDEIFSSLDLNGREGLFNVLNYLKNKGRAIYTIAHTKLASDTEYDSVVKAYKMEDGTTQIVQ